MNLLKRDFWNLNIRKPLTKGGDVLIQAKRTGGIDTSLDDLPWLKSCLWGIRLFGNLC